jgi:hypothetical protein
VEVTIRWTGPDGAAVTRDARDLIVNEQTGARFGGSDWVFAGSVEAPESLAPYAADATGLLVGLTTFGTEVVAWREMISHEADVDAPVWIADRAAAPPYGTVVTVRLRALPPAPGAPPVTPTSR